MIPLLTSIDQVPETLLGCALAVGNFDGLHRGHARLISRLVDTANDLGTSALAITFDPPPILLLKPELPALAPLTSMERRAQLLGELGVAGLLVLQTSQQLLNLAPVEFYEEVLVKRLGMRAMVEGENFRFGKDRAGDVQLLNQLCLRDNIQFQLAESVKDEQGLISSSRIRRLLADGNLVEANQMLTQAYQISGIVSKGAGRGRGLGFPTANLQHINSLIPGHGVYAAEAHWSGNRYPAAINIGPNPTFGEQQAKVEVHILGWQQDIYSQTLHCDLFAKVRDVVRFENVDQLRYQIQLDLAKIAKLLQNRSDSPCF